MRNSRKLSYLLSVSKMSKPLPLLNSLLSSWLQDTWLGSYSYELGRHNTALSLARSGVRSDAKFEGISIGMDWDKFSEIFPEFKAAKPGR